MNILGIYGSLGWDSNIEEPIDDTLGTMWAHGSGATLIMDGELKNSMCEERFSRIKYDGNYPKLSVQNILDYNKLTKHDIDLVVYVGTGTIIGFKLKEVGYIGNKLQEYFPNCKVEFLSHHMAHASATYYTSGFEEANVLTFDGSGDQELQKNGQWLIPHFKFSQGKDLILTELYSNHVLIPPMHSSFGVLYNHFSVMAYRTKMDLKINDWLKRELIAGKVMGLAAFGNYQKINLPEWYSLERKKTAWNSNIEWEESFPQLHNSTDLELIHDEELMKLNPDDLAAWSQHQFEKYLLLLLSHIPKKIKRDNLCLGGGCALNILANSKIIEQGIYKNVHVNTAPTDDGLHFGAALYKAAEYENKITLPDDIGYLGIPYTDEDIEAVLC